ncbi:unnamed protein product, partial [Didymodactylos carnosus]
HDESTFRSNEISHKRWMADGHEPFFVKGRGRSLMVSDFLVAHPSSPLLRLSDSEFHSAVKKYPELSNTSGINYETNSATASIAIGTDNYFTNDVVLEEFERLFKLLPFKKEFKNCKFEVLVDNATTHTTKLCSLSDFPKREGYRCPVDFLEWMDQNGKHQRLSCYYPSDVKEGCSKGLLVIAKELGFDVNEKTKLPELKEKLSTDAAFKTVSVTTHIFIYF